MYVDSKSKYLFLMQSLLRRSISVLLGHNVHLLLNERKCNERTHIYKINNPFIQPKLTANRGMERNFQETISIDKRMSFIFNQICLVFLQWEDFSPYSPEWNNSYFPHVTIDKGFNNVLISEFRYVGFYFRQEIQMRFSARAKTKSCAMFYECW